MKSILKMLALLGVMSASGIAYATEENAGTKAPLNDTRQIYDASSPRFIGSTALIRYVREDGTKSLCSANLVSTDPKIPSFIMTGSGHCQRDLKDAKSHSVVFPNSNKKFFIEKSIDWEDQYADYAIFKLNEKPDISKVEPLIVKKRIKLDNVRRHSKMKYYIMGYDSRLNLEYTQKCNETSHDDILRITNCRGEPGNSGGAAVASTGKWDFILGVIKGSQNVKTKSELVITNLDYFRDTLISTLEKYNGFECASSITYSGGNC